jgi:hypothetical protein
MNAFSSNYVSQLAPLPKQPQAKVKANAFDGDDHKARQACVHLPSTNPTSRADAIRRGNSQTSGAKP